MGVGLSVARGTLARLAGSAPGRIASRPLRQGPAVLLYHGVAERVTAPWIQQLHMPVRVFERQMAYVQRHFQVVSIERLAEALSSGLPLDPSWVVLTFDDGYKNVLETAAPILKSLDLPFTVFISTHHVENGERFPTYIARVAIAYTSQPRVEISTLGRSLELGSWEQRKTAYGDLSAAIKRSSLGRLSDLIEEIRQLLPEHVWAELDDELASDAPLNWQEVEKLVGFGATIGSHSHYHTILHSGEAPQEMARQLTESRDLVRRHLGDYDFVAYPNGLKGDVCDESLAAAYRAGYVLGFSAFSGEVAANCNPYLLPRFQAPGSEEMFKALMNTRFVRNRGYQRWASTLITPTV